MSKLTEQGFLRVRGYENPLKVGKILCIGRNYAEHVKELGNLTPEEPVIFLKPDSSVVNSGSKITIPAFSENCHHEAEIALVIGKTCKGIEPSEVQNCLLGIAIAVDLTLRDVQTKAKNKGLPWTVAKGFDGACPISEVVSFENVDLKNIDFSLKVNGETRQTGNSKEMLWDCLSIVSYVSKIFTLNCGDVILTGTPKGVSQIQKGDFVETEIPNLVKLNFSLD
ncbi:fumarylacetoacetate hydrolase family protein [bacterium]|nr:fumarylacetoacetate hydrolase family protein [bacterium]